MQSDGAVVNLLCSGDLACEDAKLQCDLTEKASEGHRALTLAQPLCYTDTQIEPGQAHCYQLFVSAKMHHHARAGGTMRRAGRARTRWAHARELRARARGQRSLQAEFRIAQRNRF